MAVIFPISGTFILFVLLGVFGICGETFLPIVKWIENYWWIIGIVFGAFAILQLLLSDRRLKYLHFIFDIPRIGAMLYIINKFAQNCSAYLKEGGIGIFFFVLEFILGGIFALGFLGYGSMICAGAAFNDELTEQESILKYIGGTLVCGLGALVFFVF